MSKVDAMRALREARHAAAARSVPAPQGAPVAAVPRKAGAAAPRPAAKAVKAAPTAAVETAQADEAPCGHRNMGGRSCTREKDHVQNGTKNHRYG